MGHEKKTATWPKNPQLLEINVWVWLYEMSQRYGRPLTLQDIPGEEWETMAATGFSAVWLMGIWQRSPKGLAIALKNEDLMGSFRDCLCDLQQADVVGSPYCIRRYEVDSRLGGREGLAHARAALQQRGMSLLLDFVPNHVAFDHPWVREHPEYFIQGTASELQQCPERFRDVDGLILACGSDPHFPPWPDVVQLQVFNQGLRQAVKEQLLDIAAQCDGVRCDMAMLVMNSVFAQTWEGKVGPKPDKDYWEELIPPIKSQYPNFCFIAEVYWGLERALQLQGFDYCYDKKLYDLLKLNDAAEIQTYLQTDRLEQQKLLRFIENHDEPRAAQTFAGHRHQVVALAALTLPGARLIHEGQSMGYEQHMPVFLGRRPREAGDQDLVSFYQLLLLEIARPLYHEGEWQLCIPTGWPDNTSFRRILAWSWRLGKEDRRLIVINFADSSSQARIRLPWDDIPGRTVSLHEIFTKDVYERPGHELMSEGLYVELPAWGLHLLAW